MRTPSFSRISAAWAALILALTPITVVPAGAVSAEDLVSIHVEAMGGRKRLEALSAIRATGQVLAGGKTLRFTMVAARPNRIRLETQNGPRTLVQGFDGKDAPWEFDTGNWPPRYREMAEAHVKTFTADAEFDDPLVGGAERGFIFDYAGEVEADGRKLLRLLVTRRQVETYSLFLDAETYLVVLRVEQRQTPGGRTLQVATRFDDFRPVDGVLLPHLVTMLVDGKPTQQTRIERIEPNPEITAETFSRPKPAVETRR